MQKHTNKSARLFYLLLPLAACCNPVFANHMNVPPQQTWDHPAWDLGIQALYLKPSYTDGLAYLNDTRVDVNTDRRNPVHLRWGWGFKAEASYHFCPNSDVNLNWYHYKKSSDGSFVFRTNPTADEYSITPDWDAINLEFGHSIHFDRIKTLRLHGGFQYARIKTTYQGNGIDPIFGPGTEDSFMKYTGVGPRIGTDLSVGLMDDGKFAAYFGGDAALLVGKSKFDFSETFATPFAISGSRPTVVVPVMGLKVGARYDWVTCYGDLAFDAGYMIVNYFNPLHLSDDFDAHESNFALNGWYAGINWKMG